MVSTERWRHSLTSMQRSNLFTELENALNTWSESSSLWRPCTARKASREVVRNNGAFHLPAESGIGARWRSTHDARSRIGD
jgi:hypothetical protein